MDIFHGIIKMENILVSKYDTLNLIEKRLALLVGARFVDHDKTSSAVLEMEKIRKRLSPKAKGFSGTENIRIFRNKRCGL